MKLNNRVIHFNGVIMPLVDPEDERHDSHLSETVNSQFTITESGHIIDHHGNSWMIWSLVELERWWNIFESTIGIPFGRKLFNSCCDEEEYLIAQCGLFVKGLFKNKRNRGSMHKRWQNLGWGILDINNAKIETMLPSTIAAGFAVAALESFQNKRFKSDWRQKNNTEIFLDLTLDEREIPLAQKHTKLPWFTNVNDQSLRTLELELEDRTLGWSIEGEMSVLLPVSIFSRLFHSTIGLESSLTSGEISSWSIEGLDGRFCHPLIYASHSVYQLFIDSDKHVFADSKDSWTNLLEYFCNQWGWGGIQDLTFDSDSEIITFSVHTSEMLPFLLGRIVGIWERSYGKKPKITIIFSKEITTLKIESLLAYI